MATAAKSHVVPVGRSELGSSFFRRTNSNLNFHRVPFLEIGTGGSIPCNCVIELHGHSGTGKSFSLSEMAVEALVNSGSGGSKGAPRTVLWFDADLKFNPNCIIKCVERAAVDFNGDANFEDILKRIIVFKPADVLQLVATLQSMRLGADFDDFAEIGIPIMVIVDGVSPLFVSSRASGDFAPNMFDQVCAANSNVSKHVQPVCLIFILQLIVELSAISGRGRGDMPKFQCCVVVSSVPVSNFALSLVGAGSEQVRSPGVFGSHAAFPSQSFTSLAVW